MEVSLRNCLMKFTEWMSLELAGMFKKRTILIRLHKVWSFSRFYLFTGSQFFSMAVSGKGMNTGGQIEFSVESFTMAEKPSVSPAAGPQFIIFNGLLPNKAKNCSAGACCGPYPSKALKNIAFSA